MDGKTVTHETIPYFLDLGEVRNAIEMLRPGLGSDETEKLIHMLQSMQATVFRGKVVIDLPEELKRRDIEDPDWIVGERTRLGVLE